MSKNEDPQHSDSFGVHHHRTSTRPPNDNAPNDELNVISQLGARAFHTPKTPLSVNLHSSNLWAALILGVITVVTCETLSSKRGELYGKQWHWHFIVRDLYWAIGLSNLNIYSRACIYIILIMLFSSLCEKRMHWTSFRCALSIYSFHKLPLLWKVCLCLLMERTLN